MSIRVIYRCPLCIVIEASNHGEQGAHVPFSEVRADAPATERFCVDEEGCEDVGREVHNPMRIQIIQPGCRILAHELGSKGEDRV